MIGTCHHSETLEELVVYKSLYDDEKYGNEALWVRPLAMFTGQVEVDGKSVQRFVKVSSD